MSIANFSFSPATLTVSVGTKVTWTNNDTVTHTVTAVQGAFDSNDLSPGNTFSFTFTSHIAVTLALTVFVVGLVTFVAIRIHGWHFFSYFVPQGVPAALLPLLVPIEILSYVSRLISLSVRLFANMMAGHVMLDVFGAFVIMLGTAGVIFWLPAGFSLAVNVALIGFELLVATLQAYVFAVLTCIYLHDAVHLH